MTFGLHTPVMRHVHQRIVTARRTYLRFEGKPMAGYSAYRPGEGWIDVIQFVEVEGPSPKFDVPARDVTIYVEVEGRRVAPLFITRVGHVLGDGVATLTVGGNRRQRWIMKDIVLMSMKYDPYKDSYVLEFLCTELIRKQN